MSTHNIQCICFCAEIRKNIMWLTLLSGAMIRTKRLRITCQHMKHVSNIKVLLEYMRTSEWQTCVNYA